MLIYFVKLVIIKFEMLIKIIVSFVVISLGFVMVVYTRQIVDFTGANWFVENNVGPGQTYSFVKIIGALLILLSIVYLFGGFDFLFSL